MQMPACQLASMHLCRSLPWQRRQHRGRPVGPAADLVKHQMHWSLPDRGCWHSGCCPAPDFTPANKASDLGAEGSEADWLTPAVCAVPGSGPIRASSSVLGLVLGGLVRPAQSGLFC